MKVCSMCVHVQRMLKMRRRLYTGGKFQQNVGESQSKLADLFYDHNCVQQYMYEGRSICNENNPVHPKVLYLHTS